MSDETIRGEPFDVDADPRPGAFAVVLVVIGGSIGTALRFVLGETIPDAWGVPAGILIVNVTGAALLGFVVEVLALRGNDDRRHHHRRVLLGTGVLGGYTTYSTLAVGTAELLRDGSVAIGAVYALTTVVVGVAATALGVLAGRRIATSR